MSKILFHLSRFAAIALAALALSLGAASARGCGGHGGGHAGGHASNGGGHFQRAAPVSWYGAGPDRNCRPGDPAWPCPQPRQTPE